MQQDAQVPLHTFRNTFHRWLNFDIKAYNYIHTYVSDPSQHKLQIISLNHSSQVLPYWDVFHNYLTLISHQTVAYVIKLNKPYHSDQIVIIQFFCHFLSSSVVPSVCLSIRPSVALFYFLKNEPYITLSNTS